MTMDVSKLHVIHHRIGTAECWALPGGPLRHALRWWQYLGVRHFYTAVFCRFGHHDWREGWHHRLGKCWVCWNCMRSREK